MPLPPFVAAPAQSAGRPLLLSLSARQPLAKLNARAMYTRYATPSQLGLGLHDGAHPSLGPLLLRRVALSSLCHARS